MKTAVLLALLLATATAGAAQAPAAFTGADKDGRIRTLFAAKETVMLSSELSAKIDRLTLREGDSFKTGQALVSFDCMLFNAQLKKAQATADAASKTLDVNKRLAELNSVGKLEVEQAAAKVQESGAEAAYMRTTVSKCVISAPFSGRVTKRLAAAHEFVTPGKPLLEIVDANDLELQLIVPSRWLANLKPGTPFTVQVDELNKSLPARVVRIGAKIDPVSQSISIVGKIDGSQADLLPGMSGWASFSKP